MVLSSHIRTTDRSWFFVAGEKEAITKEVTKLAGKIGLDL